MAEEVSSTVKKTSDGMVKITVEKYHELLAQAAEKPPIVHRTVHRTPEVQARDSVAIGVTCIGLGVALTGIGAYRLIVGLRVLKGLKG